MLVDVNEACAEIVRLLKARGFRDGTIKRYKSGWHKLMRYMDDNTITSYSAAVGVRFLMDVCDTYPVMEPKSEDRIVARSIALLNDYLEFDMVFPGSSGHIISTADSLRTHGSALLEFKEYQSQKHNISPHTLANYDKYIGKFLQYLEAQNATSLAEITSIHINGFCRLVTCYIEGVAYNMACSVRVFLRYLHKTKQIVEDMSAIVPQFGYSRKSKLPSTLAADELASLLASINRGNKVGKRDYAMVLIAGRLGLRSADIRLLRFQDINWEHNTIVLVTQKDGKTLTLPLLTDVGEAIIDYVKYARPLSDEQIIFLTCNAPTKPLSASGVSSIVRRHAILAGIDLTPGRHMGPHVLRHTLASALLRENVPLPEISGILSHSSTRTTQEYYLSIDLHQLKRCALNISRFPWEPYEEVL